MTLLFIARKHLLSRKRMTLLSVITGIAMLGMTLGVALLIVVMSVMNGFFDVVRDLLISFEPHLRIEAREGPGMLPDTLLEAQIQRLPGVVGLSPFVEGKALLLHGGEARVNKVVMVRGVDPRRMEALPPLETHLTAGTLDLSRRGGLPGMIISETLGNRLGLFPAGRSVVRLLSARGLEQAVLNPWTPLPAQPFEIRAWYRIPGIYAESYVFVHLREARRLFRLGRRISGYDLRLTHPEMAEHLQARIRTLPAWKPAYRVETWYERHRTLYRVMRLEKWGAVAILSIVILVAAFNLVGSLTMLTLEKRRDIGILRAMGLSRRRIRNLFLLEGLLIGGSSTFLGTLLGLLLCWLQAHFQLVHLAGAEAFLIEAYPVAVEPVDILAIGLLTLTLSLLASVYPALRAAAIPPIRVIQQVA